MYSALQSKAPISASLDRKSKHRLTSGSGGNPTVWTDSVVAAHEPRLSLLLAFPGLLGGGGAVPWGLLLS